MKKILRYSLLVALAFMSTLANAANEPTDVLDFTTNDLWKLPTAKTTAKTEYNNGTYKITIEAKSGAFYFNSGKYLMLGKKDAYITLPAFNYDVERIDVVGRGGASASVGQNIFVDGSAVSKETYGAGSTSIFDINEKNQAKGTVYTLKVTTDANTQITKILIWKKGTSTAVVLPEAANIAELKKMENNTKAKLTLTNAQVQYVGGSDIYVADATGGVDIYKTSLTYKAGQVLNGTIEGAFAVYNGLPEFMNVDNNNLKVSDGTITPKEITVNDTAKSVCQLVTIKNVTVVKNGNNFYADADKKFQIYNKYKVSYTVEDGASYDITGIVVPYGKIYEIIPTVAPTATTATGINEVKTAQAENAAAYNLAGQKVGKDYKGVVVKNGKKIIQK